MPSAFLERLMEAYRAYSPMDPGAPENRSAVVLTFVTRQQQTSERNLADKSITDLMEVANRVYNSREMPEDRQARQDPRGGNRPSRPHLQKDQCVHCKKTGHSLDRRMPQGGRREVPPCHGEGMQKKVTEGDRVQSPTLNLG